MAELLPCPTPFCSEPEPFIERVGSHLFAVRCKYCGVKTEPQYTEACAVEQWNTRLQSIPEPLLDEGLDWDEIDDVIARLEVSDQEAASYLKATDRELTGERRRTEQLEAQIAALSIPRLEAGRVTEGLTCPCGCMPTNARGLCATCDDEIAKSPLLEQIALLVGDELGGHPRLGRHYQLGKDVRWKQSLTIAAVTMRAMSSASAADGEESPNHG